MATDHTTSGRTSLRPTTEPPQETGHDKAAPDKIARCAENEVLLANRNVCAFLKAIAEAEGGGYDFKYGAIKGRQNDPWRFADFSTHLAPDSKERRRPACTRLRLPPGANLAARSGGRIFHRRRRI